MIIRSQMTPKNECSHLQNECDELCRIISASVKTAIKRKRNN
ncbi:hypothetical protein KJ966_07735 [bacterium]|nr:hypothetical protein [bacterium]